MSDECAAGDEPVTQLEPGARDGTKVRSHTPKLAECVGAHQTCGEGQPPGRRLDGDIRVPVQHPHGRDEVDEPREASHAQRKAGMEYVSGLP